MTSSSFRPFKHAGMALDPIHVGTGGTRLGRVDNTIVRDPVTRIPKIPGSSLAGAMRAYVAMETGKYPGCAGQGPAKDDGTGGHCGQADCEVCTVFGFARGNSGGFAGLAGFSDMHVLLFPVATRQGPMWVTAPAAVRTAGFELDGVEKNAIYCKDGDSKPLNLGWLLLPVDKLPGDPDGTLKDLGVPPYILERVAVVSDKLFGHVVNSNLEVRTSVAIDPATGAAEEGALFTYEALPRGTVLFWEVTCRNPAHFKVGGNEVKAVSSSDEVHKRVKKAHPLLEALGIGGMGTRGMGRLRVLERSASSTKQVAQEASTTGGD